MKKRISRRTFVKLGAAGVASLFAGSPLRGFLPVAHAAIPGGTLDPTLIPKFVTPVLVPPVMPQAARLNVPGLGAVDYYEISMRQFAQQVLPAGLPPTTVWGYGPATTLARDALRIHNAPSLTIEAGAGKPVRIKWINGLVDAKGNYLPHLLPVDPTLHWANPPGGPGGTDMRPTFRKTPGRYTGPVPIVTHLHGAVSVGDESDGYAEAWYLPAVA
jgi:spore coat protein A, manganese oxidase